MEQESVKSLADAILNRLFIEIEASGRHVHLTRAQAQKLFGHALTPKRPLSQPGQFLANERVTVLGPKGEFQNVAVLGPERKEAQVEISLTDGKALGVTPPIRQSGAVQNTPGISVLGPLGRIDLPGGLIAAQRHIHLSPEEAKNFGVTDGQTVRLQTFTARPCIFEDVVARVHPEYRGAVHLDYDEANACGFQTGDLGRILP